MRIYVLVSQARPLKVWIYKEGIVRFSSERYNLGSLDNLYSHLTNSSINKYGPSASSVNTANCFGSGIKWSFDQLKCYLIDHGHDWNKLWIRIESLINLTMINLCPLIPNLDCCFELFGFDVIVDQNMKPWLLEVNSSPAMSNDGEIDSRIKPRMIREIMRIVHVEPYVEYVSSL